MTVLAIIASAVIITGTLIIIPGPGSELSSLYSNWTINIWAIVATSLSCLTTLRSYLTYKVLIKGNYLDMNQNQNKVIQDSIDKAKHHFYICFSLTIGLVLWISAELIWTYYQLGLGIKNPFPSIADAFWLSGYPFIIYFTYGVNKALSKEGIYDRETFIMLSISAGLALGYIFNLTFGIADIMVSAQDEVGWLISIFYPILDTVALVPSLLIIALLRSRRHKFTYSIHWSLFAISIMIITIADIGFGYSEVLGRSEEEQWFWDTLYATSYIVMAGALYTFNLILRNYGMQARSMSRKQAV